MKNMFSISSRKHHEEKGKQRGTLITNMYILFALAFITLTACASSLFLLSYRNMIFNQ